jgi:hypothetical protein
MKISSTSPDFVPINLLIETEAEYRSVIDSFRLILNTNSVLSPREKQLYSDIVGRLSSEYNKNKHNQNQS